MVWEDFAEKFQNRSDRVFRFIPNKGTKKFYRAYVEVKKTNVAES